MKTKIFLLSLVALAWAGCKQSAPKSNEVEEAELTICRFDDIKETETVPLSKFVENCTLVQFENTDKALFNPKYTTVTDKYIGVRQEGVLPYKLFDRTGKFLCDINWVKQIIGEYPIGLYDDLIDDKNGLVYLTHFTGDRIFVYKTTGEFVKYITATQRMLRPKLHLTNDGVLTIVHMANGHYNDIAFQFDANGEVTTELEAPDFLMLTTDFEGEIFNTRNTHAFSFLHTSSDTLYNYNIGKNKLEPVFTISVDAQEKPFRQYMELPNHYFTFIWGKGLVCTDKKTGNSSYIKVVHDDLGNLDMPTYITHLRNGWYVYNRKPKQIIDKIEKRLQENDCTEQDKEKLNALLSKLDENSNNVAFIGKLKQ